VAGALLFLLAAVGVLAGVLLSGRGEQSAQGTTTTTENALAAMHTAPTTTTAETTTTTATTTTIATATVPSLSGKLQSALQQLRDAGFQASVAYVPSAEPFGTVVAQSPAPGATAPQSSRVTVNVSSGRSGTQQTVPSTIGMTIPDAVAAVNKAGLRLTLLRRTVTDQSQAGKVVAQTPSAGAHAPKNSQVVVYMGAYKRA
jgi:beta-lactam-binding protein with PASTA domain